MRLIFYLLSDKKNVGYEIILISHIGLLKLFDNMIHFYILNDIKRSEIN